MLFLFLTLTAGITYQFLSPQSLTDIPGYTTILFTLLGIGLYGSVYGIEQDEFKKHLSIIIQAISIGVVGKCLFIGTVVWAIFDIPEAFVLAVIVTQIDPLSVAHLVENKTHVFSKAGKTILRAWSSFDDPMTVLLCFYIFLPLVMESSGQSVTQYLSQITLNILFAGIFYIAAKPFRTNHSVSLILLIIAFVVAVPMELMLGLAVTGLYLRPYIPQMDRIIYGSFLLATFVLGSLLTISSFGIILGLVIGTTAFLSQIVAAQFLARRINQVDRMFLSLAQYNGITSIILALIVELEIPGTVTVIGVALITINILYFTSNALYERRLTATAKSNP